MKNKNNFVKYSELILRIKNLYIINLKKRYQKCSKLCWLSSLSMYLLAYSSSFFQLFYIEENN
jgi:hypothetical protein